MNCSNLIFIQYLIGKQQAEFTGDRLKSLEIPWDKMIKSTMTRAQETGKIISTKIETIPAIEHCSLLEEGAPIPPEPPIGHWRPEPSVKHFYIFSFSAEFVMNSRFE